MSLEEAHRRVLTVSELTWRIKEQLEAEFTGLWVEGEISNLRSPTSGHVYFTLKDEAAQLKAVLFRSRLRHLRFEPTDGLKVLAFGTLDVYAARGEYQLVIELLEPQGIGALQLAFEQLKARLDEEGLFDLSRKRPLPLLPQKIGLVTSPTGAAIRDILNIITRRFANLHILIAAVRVQGDEAPREIVEAIQSLNRVPELDVIIVARGGGSLEDLWAFNDEAVARAIFASEIPVISAVGHETDSTIADFVADLRAPTPSAAAELVVREKETLVRNVVQLRSRLRSAMGQRLDLLQERLVWLQSRRVLTDPGRPLRDLARRLDDLAWRLPLALRRQGERAGGRFQNARDNLLLLSPLATITNRAKILEQWRDRLERAGRQDVLSRAARFRGAVGQLESLSPLAVLGRGYSICRVGERIVRSAREAAPGDMVNVLLHRGELECRVESSREGKPGGEV
jgi:exodeoxyribonuclease VII large subunit